MPIGRSGKLTGSVDVLNEGREIKTVCGCGVIFLLHIFILIYSFSCFHSIHAHSFFAVIFVFFHSRVLVLVPPLA